MAEAKILNRKQIESMVAGLNKLMESDPTYTQNLYIRACLDRIENNPTLTIDELNAAVEGVVTSFELGDIDAGVIRREMANHFNQAAFSAARERQ